MVLPISGSTAVPNPIMLSVMGAQSFIMMYMAGEAWQYGKRKISAMTNEEFNKLTPIELLKQQQSTLKEAIPSMEQSLKDMQPMIATVAEEMIKAIPVITKGIGEGISSIINPSDGTTISPSGTQAGLLSGAKPAIIQPGLDFWQNFWNALVGAVSGAGVTGLATKVITDPDIEHVPEPEPVVITQEQKAEDFGSTIITEPHSILEQEFKPFAGQTQRLARDSLIVQIKSLSDQLKRLYAVASPTTTTKTAITFVINQIKLKQTELTQLLNRYRWS